MKLSRIYRRQVPTDLATRYARPDPVASTRVDEIVVAADLATVAVASAEADVVETAILIPIAVMEAEIDACIGEVVRFDFGATTTTVIGRTAAGWPDRLAA